MTETETSPLEEVRHRDVSATVRLLLFVRAGGRCEFDGCSRYLIEHHLTGAPGNFAQVAHICAFSGGGPRFNPELDGKSVNALDNLMLLCPGCHKFVDDHPADWEVSRLREQKRVHEDRIYKLTATRPDRGTVALVLRAQIHGRKPKLDVAEVQDAVLPRFLGPRDVDDIDLTTDVDDSSDAYWQQSRKVIEARVARFYDQSFETGPVRHASVFGLARIPLLVYFGRCLADSVPDTLHQRHRGETGEATNWRWKSSGRIAKFSLQVKRQGTDATQVALLLSLSGIVALDELPEEVNEAYTVYELTLDGQRPDLGFLGREKSLHAFRQFYLNALGTLLEQHPGLKALSVFPAVPAPVAIAMGRDRLRARHPSLLLYDLVKSDGESRYIRTFEVN